MSIAGSRSTQLDVGVLLCYINLVEITWLGHSCFRIKSNMATIVTDPFPPELGYSLGKTAASIVTVSHSHPSHSYTGGVGGEFKVLKGPGEYEIAGVLIIGVATHHDADKGSQRGKNTVYVMDVDGVSVCHLGDLGHVLTSSQVEEIGNVDVLLLPVGGVSTIVPKQASEVIRQLEPKAVIPMHYKTPAIQRELEPVEHFLKEMGQEHIETKPKINISRSNLPLSTQVFLLDYKS
ncbi:MAG: MBL fold metallo-hydrolase [Dehalococcoidales bacterium]|nr:MBL fold metallo-hydrolase [Dehalococcoidales bacterium]